MLKLILTLTIFCTSVEAFDVYGFTWDKSTPIYVNVPGRFSGQKRFRKIVKEETDYLQRLSGYNLEFKQGVGSVTIYRTNTLPFLGIAFIHHENGRAISAEIHVTNQWRLRGKELKMLRLVILHELFHVVGVGHSQDPDSVMFPILHSGDQSVTNDDIEALMFLYGNN